MKTNNTDLITFFHANNRFYIDVYIDVLFDLIHQPKFKFKFSKDFKSWFELDDLAYHHYCMTNK